jgi:hydrogenase maturation protease
MEKRDAIVVLGNPFMGDEGVGPALLDLLRKETNLPPGLDLIDTGGNILKALHALSGRRKVLFIDCALMGLSPGDSLRFLPSEVESQKQMPRLSLHEGDLLQMLETAKLLGETADQVVILGIEPERVEPGEGLSATLSSRLGFYLQQILSEFKNPM